MAQDRFSGILDEYDRCRSVHSAFTKKVASLIAELLEQRGLRVHSITDRVKE